MPFCQCGGIVNSLGKCVECGRTNTVVQTQIAATESTFSRHGPLVEEKPEERPRIAKPDNVVVLADGRAKNNYRNKPGVGTTKLCPCCGEIRQGAFCPVSGNAL